MKHIVVFTGAGISAESGLKTFRGEDGLWEGYRVEDVATPEAWAKDPEMVQHFYNIRRKAVLEAEPNAAHRALVTLEETNRVSIITQNIDDLHERAGSSTVLHLHGLITRSQSSINPKLTYPITGSKLHMGDRCELGSQLRPHVVWFGEPVPAMGEAIRICQTADIFIIIGTSLQVYPAAGLLNEVPATATKYFVDQQASELLKRTDVICVDEKATVGVPWIVAQLTT
ncbi:NAD-dependent deacylase [Parapedobacter sp. ISTM3]|uniref:NAD-dependent protein deacylase n=1 Tax=Parapedobacter luteus TaxID=623280 RepID=A0A1T5AZH2_9SPHI|nr:MULTISPECIES: Sir2 family NAD-dependent protein deacetylase [Parapedobacter]MBK1440392.1 NAD-dependent deacylase [Parapedobacter sp. ISTM3]SKB40364.1 NAD-dependent deacetylase [Parapedobacter luteus]